MKLYEISAVLQDAMERGFTDECVDLETGELDQKKFDQFITALEMAEDDKLEGIALFVKNMEAEAKAIKDEEAALAERRKAKENRAEGAKKFLGDYLWARGKEKMETAKVCLSFRKTQSTIIFAPELLRPYAEAVGRFLKYKDPEFIKADIKAALKAGEAVPGVMLADGKSLQIK